MRNRKRAIVIGSGAGGAMAAKELQGSYDVTILEEGGAFQPFRYPVDTLASFRKTGLFFDERLIQMLFPNMKILKTRDMVLVRGSGCGGTTTLATGNAVRYDDSLKAIGIHLDDEFQQLYEELPITTDHQRYWNGITKELYSAFEALQLHPVVTPKLLDVTRCTSCGHCAVGCPANAKWDSRQLVQESIRNGARYIGRCKVERLEFAGDTVRKVHTVTAGHKQTYEADVVVLAAGGLGTPVILEQSGIACQQSLFVDPVLCVAAPYAGAKQNRQILMPFISQQENYILSPYMDYLSFFFHKDWRLPMQDMVSLMIKLADEETGTCCSRPVEKPLTAIDRAALEQGVAQCKEVLRQIGIRESDMFLGTVNAGHPGGMLPLTAQEKDSMHHSILPQNLYIADATVLPKSMGNPPMLTIMALAKRVAGVIKMR